MTTYYIFIGDSEQLSSFFKDRQHVWNDPNEQFLCHISISECDVDNRLLIGIDKFVEVFRDIAPTGKEAIIKIIPGNFYAEGLCEMAAHWIMGTKEKTDLWTVCALNSNNEIRSCLG